MASRFQYITAAFCLIIFLAACTTQVESPDPISTAKLTATNRPAVTPKITASPTPTTDPFTTILFTGVIVPARCVQAGIDERGTPHDIYDNVRDILVGADFAVGVLNAALSDSVTHQGCVKNWELVGRSENADALKEAGFDLMSVATNHIKDCGWPSCGDTSFFDTLANLERVGIPYVGAGPNHETAMQPYVVTIKGVRFGFVSLGEITPRVFADDETPGIAELNEANLRAAIESLKGISDVIIVLPHSGPEDTPERTPNQYKWARVAVDAGADLVVMNHAHVIQGYQLLEGVPIFYGLGNFVFDQDWARDHAQSVILLVKFLGDKFISFEFIPTVTNERNGIVLLPDEEEAQEIIDRIKNLSEALEE